MAPPTTPLPDDDELRRRRRGRNWALLVALLAISGLFYAIAIVKLSRTVAGG